MYYVSKNGNVNLFIFYYSIISDFLVVIRSMDIDGFMILDYVFFNILIFYKDNVNRVLYCNIYLLFLVVNCNVYRFLFYMNIWYIWF